jgi:alpha-ketoglutarate-dependent taurine dioxygenase
LVADELFTVHIEGQDNYQEFIKPVIEQMMTKNTIYSHEWQENDLMIYDNWSLMHNSIRKLKRITWDQDWYKFDIDIQFDDMMMLGRGPGGWPHDAGLIE